MSSTSNVQPAEGGRCSHQKALLSPAILSEGGEGHLEPEENEDEDVDFNPFLKETPSSEASSSLSSENEGLGADVVDNMLSSSAPSNTNFSSKLTNKVHDFASRDSENDEEVVMQTRLSPEGSCGEESEAGVQEKLKKRKLSVTFQQETEAVPGSCGTDAVEDDAMKEELPDLKNRTSIVDLDEEDAICRRTRARYSLANFTLDELETFLQESDDEADLRYVDDEEEYRKFLAAVLQGGDSESQAIQENENVDDEDEENDADFEIEIEEALESDLDESQPGKGQKNKHEGVGRRPETRQNRRQKASVHGKRNLLGLANRPLRPLLPFVPNTQLAPFPALDLPQAAPETGPHFSSSSAQSGLINGFTGDQIGQLYCLIHEHMQLLIQVFSLCVLEPSRQHIAGEVQRMISEMVHKRDEVLAWRNVPYPNYFFHPPYIHSSVSHEFPQFYQGDNTVDSSFAFNGQKECPSTNNMMPVSHSSSHCGGRIYEHTQVNQVDPNQIAESSFWMPLISGPVLSVLDVAPLRLVGGYVAEVSTAVQKYQQRHVEGVCASPFDKEPLFPLPSFPPVAESNSEVLRGSTPQGPNTSSPTPQQPKKTLAATLVESTKKQSVALVQKDIVKLVQRFFPLFNSALFPHKPPPVAVANRVLFTDAEDELLALGLMEYNTDWKAIQQRFLPSKTKHQIFVRQKNRCSSKAPENPIKAVRRMKTSPLTAEEKARIHEGLRIFKLDWMSIWKFIVPYRDPSLLPRQWRVALGTQKSYKSDAAKKEKRRLYESMRRKSKAAELAYWQATSEKEDYPVDNAYGGNNSGDDNVDDEDEAYVHEAFLADWRPENSRLIYSELPQSRFSKGNKSGDLSSQEGACVAGKFAGVGDRYGETHSKEGHMHDVLPSIYTQHLQNISPYASVRYNSLNIMASNHLASDPVSKSAKKQVHLRPYRVRRSNSLQLVKLAPDLPPVNLPPSVRVISQSAFKSYCAGSSSFTKTNAAATAGGSGGSGHAAGAEDQVPRLNIAKSSTTHSVNAGKHRTFPINHNTANPCSKVSGLPVDQHVAGEKHAELDLQMHPLLFQAPEDGCFPYYPLNCGATSGTLSLLPGNQLQANFNLFCKPQSMGQIPSTPGTIEFHPLLQKTDDVSTDDSVPPLSACHRSVDLESHRGHCSPETSVLTEPQARSGLSPSSAIPSSPASPSDKNSELDLEIHLSSTSRKEKVVANRAITKHNSKNQEIRGENCGTTMANQWANGSSYQGSSPHYLAVSVASKYSNKGTRQDACPMVLASNSPSTYAEDIRGQQFPQEIVMEQEELSDSDEELGENVEFECEEMADSDGEGSDFEQFVNLQNKKASSPVVEEDVFHADRDSEQGMQTDAHDTKGDTRSCKSGLSNKAGEASNNALVVNLDSQALGPSTCSKPKFRGGGKGDDQIGRSYSQNGLPPRPSRSCKRVTPNSRAELHHLDMPNQQSLGSAEGAVVCTPGTKPRNRSSRSNYTKGNSNCISSDSTVDRRPDDGCPKVEDDVRVSTPMSSNALQTGGNTGAQGLK